MDLVDQAASLGSEAQSIVHELPPEVKTDIAESVPPQIADALPSDVKKDILPDSEEKPDFDTWKQTHKKEYSDDSENEKRKKNWNDNHSVIEKLNEDFKAGTQAFKVAHNVLSDLDKDEFGSKCKGFNAIHQVRNHDTRNYKLGHALHGIPESIDWRKHGYVNPIQAQGSLGCCYAFSACAAIEGQYFAKHGKLIKLSEQNIVDCSTGKYGNNGGISGTMDNAFDYVIQNGGIDSEESYPYTEKAGTVCKYDPTKSLTKISSYVNIPSGDEKALTKAIATIGPICAGIDASQQSFQFYKSGIYDDKNCKTLPDHAVVIVGYGSDGPGKDYYIVRNSWGTTWGEDGYVRMPRNRGNFAGIATMASYPLI